MFRSAIAVLVLAATSSTAIAATAAASASANSATSASASAAASVAASVAASTAASAASSTGTKATVTPAKQELMQRLMQLWHVEAIGDTMLQQPVTDALQQARAVLQSRVPAERQDAAMRDVAADAQKFLDEARPLVRSSTQKLIPSTVMPLLAERFTEDELRQIIKMLESPVKRKFEAMLPELQKALGQKIAADTGPLIDPKIQEMKQSIGLRLRTAVIP